MAPSQPMSLLSATADGVSLAVKVVPGASRTRIMGMLGDRLKVSVAAPPEDGKANKAVCELLAEGFDLPPRDVQVVGGQTRPEKTIELLGISLCSAAERLNRLLSS